MRTILPLFAASSLALSGAALANPDMPKFVVVSYPATVDPTALETLRRGMEKSNWPHGCGNFMAPCAHREQAVEDTLTKTAYFASEFYDAFAKKFGREHVILEPGFVTVGADGELLYKIPDPELPAAARVDVAATVAPYYFNAAPSSRATHGHFFQPAYVITDGAGKLLATSEKLDAAVDGPGQQPSVLIRWASLGSKDKIRPESAPLHIKPDQREFDEAAWGTHISSPTGAPPLAAPLIEQDIASVVSLVNAAQVGGYSSYKTLFSQQIQNRPDLEAALPQFIDAEAQFVTKASLDTLIKLRSGDFGASMRKRLDTERKLNKKAATANWIGGLFALTGAVSNFASGVMIGPDALMATMKMNMQLDNMNSGFNSAFAPLGAEQVGVAVRVGDKLQNVQAHTLGELRSQFRALLAAESK